MGEARPSGSPHPTGSPHPEGKLRVLQEMEPSFWNLLLSASCGFVLCHTYVHSLVSCNLAFLIMPHLEASAW